jgi:ATP-dependent helicase/DNAse subunit B
MYSFSQLQLFAQCPRKYQFRYIDKIEKEFESSADLILGNAVHTALEHLYNQVNVFVIPTIDDVVTYFHDERKKLFDEATKDKELQIK